MINGANNTTFCDVNAMLLSTKKSVIYDPAEVYLKFVIVENPTSVSKASQASWLAICDCCNVTPPPNVGKELGT